MTAAAKGMGDLSVADVLIGKVPLGQLVPITNSSPNPTGVVQNVTAGVTDCVLGRTVDGASTVILSLQDPYPRSILRSGIFSFADTLTFDGLEFVNVADSKTGDQLQLTFEAAAAYNLRQQKGPDPWASANDLDGFVQHLINAVPGVELVCQPGPVSFGTGSGATASTTVTSIMRGTTAEPNEDSWTCINRLANSADNPATLGRLSATRRVARTIYMGSDSWLLTEFPSAGTIREFTTAVMNIDGTYDVGMPLGQLTVTAISNQWTAKPGQPIDVAGMGVFDGTWLVYSMQRNLFNPQASITLQKAMSAEQVRLGLPTLQFL